MSNNQGVWCSKCYGDHYTNDCPEPVAPVESKTCTCPTSQWIGSEPNDSTCALTEEEHEAIAIEAKDKEIGDSFHWCRFCGKATEHDPKSSACLNCGTIDQHVAEPKPTPSAPAPIEAFCPKCRISITNTTAGVHECPACHGPVAEPQPQRKASMAL